MPPEAERAAAWWWKRLTSACDSVEPWQYGHVARSRRHPTYYELNTVIVERETGLGADVLAAEVDRLLADAAYRRITVLEGAEAGRLRAGLVALGYEADPLLYLRHENPARIAACAAVHEVGFDEVIDLRREWAAEDGIPDDFDAFYPHYREVALARGARVLAVLEALRPLAYAQLEAEQAGIEVGEVFVSAERRGQGLGTTVTSAAIEAAATFSDVWICADAEGRAWPLYERLGFRRVWELTEFQRRPTADATAEGNFFASRAEWEIGSASWPGAGRWPRAMRFSSRKSSGHFR